MAPVRHGRIAAVLVAALGAPHGPWKVEDFPDPVTQPLLCGRNVSGWICDPDHVLGPLSGVDDQLRAISTQTSVLCGAGKLPFQMGVAVVGALDRTDRAAVAQDAVPPAPVAVRALGGWGPQALATDAERFAEQLGNTWAIGQERCNNGIMLLLVVQDSVVVLKTGPGARDALPDDTVVAILQDMRSALRGGDWAAAVRGGVHDVGLALRGEYRREPDFPLWVRVLVVAGGSLGLLLSPVLLACLIYPVVYCCSPAPEGEIKQLRFAPQRLIRLYLGVDDDHETPELPLSGPFRARSAPAL